MVENSSRKTCRKCFCSYSLDLFFKNRSHRDGLSNICKFCDSKRYKKTRKIKKNVEPWTFTLYEIRKRCLNPKFRQYKDYGGRGIKCLITKEELKYLWFRDKAYLLKNPSIDRINNDGNYELTNCTFIELIDNTIKAHTIDLSNGNKVCPRCLKLLDLCDFYISCSGNGYQSWCKNCDSDRKRESYQKRKVNLLTNQLL